MYHVGEQGQFGPQGEQSSSSPIGEQANTGEYAGEYLQKNSSLQEGAEPAFADPAPRPIGEEELTDFDALDWLNDDQRHSQISKTRSETTAVTGRVIAALPPSPPPKLTPLEVTEMLRMICDRHTDAGRMALAHVERDEHSPKLIADALCSQLKKPEGYADRYLKRLPEALEELRQEVGGSVVISTGSSR